MTAWLDTAVADVSVRPETITRYFPVAGRTVGREPLDSADPQGLRGSADDVARARLVAALLRAADAATAARTLTDLYRHGDDAERRGVLRGLDAVPSDADALVTAGMALVDDALRTNDPRIVAAAMGGFAGRFLPSAAWRGGVLKCLFMQIPLSAVTGVEQRRDADLKAQAKSLAAERLAAGRALSRDLTALLTDQPVSA